MSARPRKSRPAVQPSSGGLDPAILRLIEAMARADVARDLSAVALPKG